MHNFIALSGEIAQAVKHLFGYQIEAKPLSPPWSNLKICGKIPTIQLERCIMPSDSPYSPPVGS